VQQSEEDATLNPLLYYYRMSAFRQWMTGSVGFNRLSAVSSITSVQGDRDRDYRDRA